MDFKEEFNKQRENVLSYGSVMNNVFITTYVQHAEDVNGRTHSMDLLGDPEVIFNGFTQVNGLNDIQGAESLVCSNLYKPGTQFSTSGVRRLL